AGIDEIERARFERPVGRVVDPVVDDGAVRPGAGDRLEGEIDELGAVARRRLAAEGEELRRRGDLVEAAVSGRPVEPGEEADHRRAVAEMRAAGSGELCGILPRLGKRRRVLTLDNGAA